MKRRNTLNFLQIENGLREAIALCQNEKKLKQTDHYQEPLEQALLALEAATSRTDATYLTWRASIKTRLLAAKHLWQVFERIRDELGEYGVDPQPSGRYNYWEPDIIDAGASELITFLGGLGPEVTEAKAWADELDLLLRDLRSALNTENTHLEQYKQIAPRRRQAIYHAMNIVDEFHTVRADYR